VINRNQIFSTLLVFTTLVGCGEKTVKLGPITEERISTGESAKAALKEETDIRARVEKLEAELVGWIERAQERKEAGNISTHLRTFKDSTDCSLQIESDQILTSWDFAKHIKKLGPDFQNCPTLILIAEKLVIPAKESLQTFGRHLHIFADLITLDGTISTQGPEAAPNQNGVRGGDLNIYTLSFRTGPEAKIITSGSDAGPVQYSPTNLSRSKIKSIQKELIEKGVDYTEKRGKQVRIPAATPSHEQIASAYKQVEDKASEYIQALHPDYSGKAPNPFPGDRRVLAVGGKKYFWAVAKTEIDIIPTANKNFAIEIPLQNLDEVKTAGVAGHLRIYSAEKQNNLPRFNIEQAEGSVPLQSSDRVPAWNTASINAPIAIRHTNKTEYTFQLFQKYKSTPVKSWTVLVPSQEENSPLQPKLVYVAITNGRKESESDPSSPRVTFTAFEQVVQDLKPKAVNFLEAGIKRTGLESIDLPNGLKNLSDWTKEWIDLSGRASRLKIKLER